MMAATETTPIPEPAVLTSWKEIARYLGKSVRSVQRYEQHLGLPVRRPCGASHRGTVLVSRKELDRWLNSCWAHRCQREDTRAPSVHVAQLIDSVNRSRALWETYRRLRIEYHESYYTFQQELAKLRARKRQLSGVAQVEHLPSQVQFRMEGPITAKTAGAPPASVVTISDGDSPGEVADECLRQSA